MNDHQYTFHSSYATRAIASWFQVALPNGSTFDISTKQGANEFLKDDSGVELFSSKIQQISSIRTQRKWKFAERDKLFELYSFLQMLARNADPKLFLNYIPESAVQKCLNSIIQHIQKLSTNRDWIKTGTLSDLDEMMLESCIAIFHHALPVVLAFEGEFFPALAALVNSRKKHSGQALPCERICLCITSIVYFAIRATMQLFDNEWDEERTFKKLEASGILGQALRCLTVPQLPENTIPGTEILRGLQNSPVLISKQFQKGKPSGDLLRAILSQQDGSRNKNPDSSIVKALQNVARISNEIDVVHNLKGLIIKCGHCEKKGTTDTLMKCSRCRGQHYCSKECQRLDWKKHKPYCSDFSKTERRHLDTVHLNVSDFLEKHNGLIFDRMIHACGRTGLSCNDMAIEISWVPRKEDGIIPALQNPPMFDIVPLREHSQLLDNFKDLSDPIVLNGEGIMVLHFCKTRFVRASPCTEEILNENRRHMFQAKCTRFIIQRLRPVMTQLIEYCDQNRLEPKDCVVEVDFGVHQGDGMPSLDKPPVKYSILHSRDYSNGSRVEAPNWFSQQSQDPQLRERNKQLAMSLMEENSNPTNTTFLVHYADCIERFDGSEFSAFDSEAIDIFRQAGDFAMPFVDALSAILYPDSFPE